MAGKLCAHETLAVANSVVSPATTLAEIQKWPVAYVMMSTTQAVRFTVDGQTDPVITGSSEVGCLLSTTDKVCLTIEEFLNLRLLDVSTDARVQFEFLAQSRRQDF